MDGAISVYRELRTVDVRLASESEQSAGVERNARQDGCLAEAKSSTSRACLAHTTY
jgi:hypothetical protein